MKKERPILMSTPMVQSTLAHLKIMTRRTKGLERFNEEPDKWYFSHDRGDGYYCFKNPNYEAGGNVINPIVVKCPYGQVGDILWVRETWMPLIGSIHGDYGFKADLKEPHKSLKWKPSIFMPRKACRLYLEITDLRVEQLQQITENDAIAEGVEKLPDEMFHPDHKPGQPKYKVYHRPKSQVGLTARQSFFSLWESINEFKSWKEEGKKFVWVISFKIIDHG